MKTFKTLGILGSAVPFQLGASTRPIQLASDKLSDNGDDVIEVTDELFRRVSLSKSDGSLGDGCKKWGKQGWVSDTEEMMDDLMRL